MDRDISDELLDLFFFVVERWKLHLSAFLPVLNEVELHTISDAQELLTSMRWTYAAETHILDGKSIKALENNYF